MKTLALVLTLLMLQQPQDKEKTIPKEPIKDWKWRRTDSRFDPKTRTEVEELTVVLRGKEAIPVDSQKMIFDLRGVKANYFTTPEKNKISKEIVVEADRGRYDHTARTLSLKDNVRVVKKNDDENMVDTVLTASSALLKFNKMYECPSCGIPLRMPGRCPIHNEPLKEMTLTNLTIDGEFELAGPEGILSGEGLETDDELRKHYHIQKNGFIEFGGDSSSLLQQDKPPSPKPSTTFAQIFSRGPLRITGDEYQRRIVGEGGMRVDRIDDDGTVNLQAQNMTIDTLRLHNPTTQKVGSPEIRMLDARGKVVLDGVTFEDGQAFQTTSDSLLRTIDGFAPGERITLDSSDVPVHVKSGPNTIEARKVRIYRKEGASAGDSVFEEVFRSDLVSGDQHFALKCDVLTTKAGPNDTGRTDVQTLHAEGRVVLGGLMAAKPGSTDDPGEAHADTFDWDIAKNRGQLKATPFVRITQGGSIIVAPQVVLESPKIMVLKGPKQATLVQDREGEKEEYRATCEGDMILDNNPGVNRLWMRNACVIRTKELLLHSDRVNAALSPDGTSLETLNAYGHVQALKRQDQTTVYGDRLAYRFKDQDTKVYGEPYAWADTGRSIARQEQIRIYERRHPKTGQMIRYTEMIGGRDGLRIEIDERARLDIKK